VPPPARAVLVVLALTVAACGDSAQEAAPAERPGAVRPERTIVPPVSGGGGPTVGAQAPRSPQPELVQFRRDMDAACRRAGERARISSGANDVRREREMQREVRYLTRLHRRVANVEAPEQRLERLHTEYLEALEAQIALDRRIALAAHDEDDHSVAVGMEHNAINRNDRNAVVAKAGLSDCLRAPAPR
jgi:hypothetical protein